MAQTPNEILTRAADQLQDASNVRWTQAELLRYLNDGRRELAIHRPDVYSTITTMTLVAGAKQTIPADGNKFIDVVRNINANDAPGRSVRIIEREILDAQSPDWHTMTSSNVTRHFMFDERAPKNFYVYPAASAGHKLEVVYSQSPVDVTDQQLSSTSVLAREDIYVGTLLDYILYRAYSKDAEYAGNLQRADLHYRAFATSLGLSNRKRIANSPNIANMDGTPPKSANLEVA